MEPRRPRSRHCNVYLQFIYNHNLSAIALANGNSILIKTTPTCCCESQQSAVCQEVKEFRRRVVGNQLCQFKESVVLHMKKHALTRRNTLTHTCARTLAVLSPFTSVSCEATADTSASLFLASACKTQAHMLKCRSAEQQCQLSLHLVALS